MALNASRPVPFSTLSAAAAYSASNDAPTISLACPARMPNWPIWLTASAGAGPCSMRGSCGVSETARNRDARPCAVVLALAERHDDAQAVDRAALKDGDEHPAARGSTLGERRTREKRRREPETDQGEGAVFQKDATRDHGVAPSATAF